MDDGLPKNLDEIIESENSRCNTIIVDNALALIDAKRLQYNRGHITPRELLNCICNISGGMRDTLAPEIPEIH